MPKFHGAGGLPSRPCQRQPPDVKEFIRTTLILYVDFLIGFLGRESKDKATVQEKRH
jgi:hypothetical protein